MKNFIRGIKNAYAWFISNRFVWWAWAIIIAVSVGMSLAMGVMGVLIMIAGNVFPGAVIAGMATIFATASIGMWMLIPKGNEKTFVMAWLLATALVYPALALEVVTLAAVLTAATWMTKAVMGVVENCLGVARA